MSKRKIIIIGAAVIVAALLAAAIATTGGIVGYLVAKRFQGPRLPWHMFQQEGPGLPAPFSQPLPEMRGGVVILPFGAQVTWVEEGSPAEEAGIKVGDIITGMDGQEIDEEYPLRDLILEHEPGEKVTLTLNRWGESKEVQVTLGETKDEEGATIPYLGVRYWSMIRRESEALSSGAQVTWVEEGSAAEEAGIKVGDIITGLDGQEIDEEHPLRELILEHEPGEKVTLTLNRWGESEEVQVTLGESTDEGGETIPYLGVSYRSIRRRFFEPQRLDLSRLPQRGVLSRYITSLL